MKARLTTAGLGIPLLVFVALSPEPFIIRIFSSVLTLALAIEFLRAEKQTTRLPLLFLALMSPIPPLLGNIPPSAMGPLFLLWILFFTTGIPLRRKNPFLFNLFAIPLWFTLPNTLLVNLRELDMTPARWWELQPGSVLLLVFISQWSADTAGMIGGRLFGKKPLAPSISPKKTWEGALANAVTAILIALAGAHFLYFLHQETLSAAIIGASIAIFGQGGDLFQSAWKRQLGIKDSGTILPGHGGLLDRFDSLLTSIPPITFTLTLLGHSP